MIRAYEEIVDFIAAGVTPAMVAGFEASQPTRDRVAELLSRAKTTGRSDDETSELEHFIKREHVMRLAKARASGATPHDQLPPPGLRRRLGARSSQ